MQPSSPRKRLHQALAAGVAIATMAASVTADVLSPISGFSTAFALIAILASSLLARPGYLIGAALFATAASLIAATWEIYATTGHIGAPGLEQLVWVGGYWVAASLLLWDPRRANVAIEQLRDVFEDAPAAMAVVDTAGKIIHTNHAFAELTGKPAADLDGRYLDDLIGQAVWQDVLEERNQLLTGKQDHIRFEREFTRHDGAVIWASIYGRLLRDPAGNANLAIVQVIDLTEQRNAQRALGISESRFRGIIENTAEVTLVIDGSGVISYANPSAHDLLEVDAETLVGRSPMEFVHPTSRGEVERAMVKSRQHTRRTRHLSNVRLIQAAETYLDLQLTDLSDTAGINGTVITGRVTTEQVMAEKHLRDSEAKFSTIFHSSPDAVLILRNDDSTIIDFNVGFTRLLGYTREEVIGLLETDLNMWADPRDRERIHTELRTHFECLDYEADLVAKNGELINTEISVRFIELEGEVCVLCIGRDISKRLMAEAALKESEDKFARIFSGSPDGIAIISLEDGTILDINDAFLVASGYELEELLGYRIDELEVFADGGDLLRAREIIEQRGTVQNQEFSFRTKNDDIVPALISATVIEINGESSLVCIAKDNRRQRETERQLRRSEERFRGAFANAPIGMILVDTEGRIFQANKFSMDLLAYEEDQLLGSHISRLVPTDDRRGLKEIFRRLLAQNDSVEKSERRMLSRSSIEIWTNFHVVLQRGEDGSPLYFIVQIADITEMRRSQEQMERLAFYDTLTDLANRRLFSNRLEQAIEHVVRTGTHAALLYLDLDQFKRVNDTLGHEAGDELLKEVGRRISDCVRAEDTVARPGGDEFTVLLYDITSPADAGTVAEKILQRLRRPISISSHEIVITTSIGITILPEDSDQPNTLTKNADLAMYRAKERGRNNYQFFSEDMNTQAITKLRTENELRRALDAAQFELYFQPKVRIRDQRIVGVEALIRWHHPTRGLLAPDQFISVAEETGVIIGIGSWVIQQSAIAARRLADQCGAPIQVGINLSPRQFRDATLVTTIRRCIRQAGIDPAQIEIEITETMLMDDAEAATLTVDKLHELGVKLAIDDFGTGYSSLNYLRRFPIDTVKIDRSFVMDIPDNPDDEAITAAVIAMAHRLNLQVVAEGVETAQQLEFLAGHDCEFAQGYYFAKPLPIEEMEQLINPNVKLLRSPRPRPAS